MTVRYCPICDIAECATHRPVAAPEITIGAALAKVRAWAEEMFIVDTCVDDREPGCISCTILTALEAMEQEAAIQKGEPK